MPDSFSWNFLHGPSETSPADQLPTGIVVERFALSCILMPYTNLPTRAITVVNLHPESWNSFMFPYGGLRLDDAQAAKEARTFADLSNTIHRLTSANLREYLAKASEELLAYYSDIPDLGQLAPIYRNYSLKFSKSANKWTAYMFTYHPCPLSLLMAEALAHNEIGLNAGAVATAIRTQQLDGTDLEENVVAFLQSDIIKFWSEAPV